MFSASVLERRSVVRNLAFGDYAFGTLTTALDVSSSAGETTLILTTRVVHGSFFPVSCMTTTGTLSKYGLETLSESFHKFIEARRATKAQLGEVDDVEIAEKMCLEHVIFVHSKLSEWNGKQLSEYKFTGMAFMIAKQIGVKRPVVFLSNMFDVSVTAINRRIATAREKGFIPYLRGGDSVGQKR